MTVCQEWLEEHGRCDLDQGHFPDTPHLLVTALQGTWAKTVWPFPEDDADVRRYLAVAQAYEEEDDRRMAAKAPLDG